MVHTYTSKFTFIIVMDFGIPFALVATYTILFLLFLFLLRRVSVSPPGKLVQRPVPEVPGAWPLIGHLRLLSGPKLPHVVMGEMADKYGHIFSLRLGVHRVVVVSSWEMVKECFTTNDKAFAKRPKSIALEHMGYNFAMFAFNHDANYWREMRKITSQNLLSSHRLAMFDHVRVSELKEAIKKAYEQCCGNDSGKATVEMKSWFSHLTLNVICRVIAGRKFTGTETTEGDRKALRRFFELMGLFTVGDSLPGLRWLDVGGYEKEMKKTAKELDSFLWRWLEEHNQRRSSGKSKEKADEEKDFIDVMLDIFYESKGDGDGVRSETRRKFDVDTIIKATCLTHTLGASDSTTVTLTWALTLLLNNRDVLKKAQHELDTHIGRDRQVNETDMKNLVYLQAIVKESLRLYPAAQLSPAREALEDCQIGGYHVQAGTRLFVNLYKVQRDPRVWSDPEKFIPERFMEAQTEVDVRGQHFELIPFGTGRRRCPGISLALQIMQFSLASLMHAFEIVTPLNEPVDMTMGFGLSNIKATSFDVVLTPRLPAHLY